MDLRTNSDYSLSDCYFITEEEEEEEYVYFVVQNESSHLIEVDSDL